MSGMAPNDTRDNKKPNNAQDLNDHHIITSRYTLHVTESEHFDFVLASSSRTGKKETARLFTPDSDILSLI